MISRRYDLVEHMPSLGLGTLLLLLSQGLVGHGQDLPNQERRILDKLPYSVEAVCFSRDGKWLAAGGGRAVRVWDAKTWEPVVTLRGFEHSVPNLAFSPDGKTLAVCEAREYARLYDTATWKIRRRLGSYFEVVYSADGKTLITTGGGSFVFLVNPENGDELDDFQWPNQFLSRLALAPDGKTLAGGAARGAVALYDLKTRKVLAQLKGHEATVTAVAFSPDGKTLVSADLGSPGRCKVFLWDVGSRERKRELDLEKAKVATVNAAAFSPDGKTLALVRGGIPFVYLFDVASGDLWGTLTTTGRAGWSESVAFSPDGQTLVTGCADGTCKVWDVPKRK